MKKIEVFAVGGALLVAFCLKLILILTNSIPFNSDEAIVALMAKHILQGAKPIFFYGQAYMGSIDAWILAAAFKVFGESVTVLRYVQIFLYLLYILTLWILARRLFTDPIISYFAIWVAAIPTVLVTTYTSATLGGYSESLILGNLILILGFEVIIGDNGDKWIAWILLGFLAGIAFWTLGIAGVYILPIVIIGLWKFNKTYLAYYLMTIIAFFIGSIPWWYYNMTNSWGALAVITGTSNISLTSSSPLFRLSGFFLLGVPSLLGFRFPWSPEFASLPILFLFLFFYGAVLVYFIRRVSSIRHPNGRTTWFLLGLFVLIFIILFVGTHFGIDSTGRYLLPLNLVLVLTVSVFLAASLKINRYWGIGLLFCILALNGFETARAAQSSDKITTQFDPISRFNNRSDKELIEFLQETNQVRGYSNYWVSYRLAFTSDEQIIYSPKLPYKQDLSYTKSDNRYPLYDEMVTSSSQVAYITTKHPQLDQIIRQGLMDLDVSFLEKQIGDYHIFYDLSEVVYPAKLGFGGASP